MILYRADMLASNVEAFECDNATDDFIEIKGSRYRRQGNCFETEAKAWQYLLTINTKQYNYHSRETERCSSNIEKCNVELGAISAEPY